MMLGTPFASSIESRNGVTRVTLTGELDLSTAPALSDQLVGVEVPGTVEILLDLRNLTFVDGSGLRALLAARGRADANGHRLTLIGARAPARRLFEITGTQFLIDQVQTVRVLDRFTGGNDPTIAEAVASGGAPGA